MKFLGTILLVLSSTAIASTNYDLKMSLSMNGKHVSSPRIIVEAGRVAMITQRSNNEESFIEVLASESEKPGIVKMEFTVGNIDENGQRVVIAKPSIIAKENSKAEISIKEEGRALSLSVVAQKKI